MPPSVLSARIPRAAVGLLVLLAAAAGGQQPDSLVVRGPLTVTFEAESRLLGAAGERTVVELTAAVPLGRQEAGARRALEATPFTVEATISGPAGRLETVARPLPPPQPGDGGAAWRGARLLLPPRPGA
ncbi:MAG TPA: hypothetical protein PK598_07640, partial [Thermoanaerobaculia bacterium]|nr:hypothetical protein [Thermoanaerobaculia bacterium]